MPSNKDTSAKRITRRQALTHSFGAISAGAVGIQTQSPALTDSITTQDLAVVDKVAGRTYSEKERGLMAPGMGRIRDALKAIREVDLDNRVDPAVLFHPLLPGT